MSWQRWWLAVGLSTALLVKVRTARAEVSSSCRAITRSNLVACVLGASLARRAGGEGIAAAEGRVAAAAPWFPSSPAVALTGSRREGAEGTALNWSASLGVEVEVAGQRGARRGAALADTEAQRKSAQALDRSTAAEAWRIYFEVLAAEETVHWVERLEGISKRLWDAAKAAADRGALPGVEADLLEASYVRVVRRRIEVRSDRRKARGALAALLGLDSEQTLTVEGKLEPLAEAASLTTGKLGDQPEAAVLEAEGRAFLARADAQRRSRVPNPTVSVFIQNDGFNEKVLGVGLAFPMPLPEPVGRMSSGEIAENEALARRAKLLAADSRRRAHAELLQALASYQAAQETTHEYTQERVERSERTLQSLATEVEAGRIGTRDAVILQGPLFELLLGAVEARRLLCVASADVARAGGVRLEDGAAR